VEDYRIVLADNHVIFRQGMKRLIDEEPGLEVVGEANDGSELVNRLHDFKPDLVILDISMPEIGGIDAAREIRNHHPNVKVLMLTMHNNMEYLYHAISAGAQGYLLKEDSDIELFSAIETIQKGGVYVSRLLSGELTGGLSDLCKGKGKLTGKPLSNREIEILKLIAEGKLNKEIADLFEISVRTVEKHRANILKKLNLNKTVELVRYAIQHGIAELTF
jgi:DNA-binding NarL/FixJ family response regulator